MNLPYLLDHHATIARSDCRVCTLSDYASAPATSTVLIPVPTLASAVVIIAVTAPRAIELFHSLLFADVRARS